VSCDPHPSASLADREFEFERAFNRHDTHSMDTEVLSNGVFGEKDAGGEGTVVCAFR
jgi:zona occludens toxin (predicted ATPase)